jgi:hypothetical protein
MTTVRIFRMASNNSVNFQGHSYKANPDNVSVNPVDNAYVYGGRGDLEV